MIQDNHIVSKSVLVTSFYKFCLIEVNHQRQMKLAFETTAKELDLFGQIILAHEGINGTVAGTKDAIILFRQALPKLTGKQNWFFKNSTGQSQAFRKFVVKIRKEIVTSSNNLPVFNEGTKALSPQAWNEIFENENVVLLDVRNWYEARIGRFEGAIDLDIKHFRNFCQAFLAHQVPRDKKLVTYCTGGIRCEKAVLELERLGYWNVFQLQGGILNYLEQFPNKYFQGECFVFDDRVSLGQDLSPTASYSFCPHCGQPARETIRCEHCDQETRVCDECLVKEFRKTCSLNCAYQQRFCREHRLRA